eukprot:Lithocolla_globosa_v1_NODE_1469_length_2548_cov_94.431207.p2 type:complete len:108 gc:universal NODE_1469_length_2548_cov_94.431207:2110-1787(-)
MTTTVVLLLAFVIHRRQLVNEGFPTTRAIIHQNIQAFQNVSHRVHLNRSQLFDGKLFSGSNNEKIVSYFLHVHLNRSQLFDGKLFSGSNNEKIVSYFLHEAGCITSV